MRFSIKYSNHIINLPDNNLNISLSIKTEDKVHPFISGNKYFKLKYNLLEARKQGFKTILTFGGAYSNHISAVASAGKEFGFKTIGIIRGQELADKISENSTLHFARECGMAFNFIPRKEYRLRASEPFLDKLKKDFGACYMLPEGGTNAHAVMGCEEILNEDDRCFDYVCCPVGTGGTIAGIINSASPQQHILGFPALKGGFLKKDICKFATRDNWELINAYHFGGYAKINHELIQFMNSFKAKHAIALDPIYTGKMMFGVLDLINKGYFKRGSKILAIHTGGLQGIVGMNAVLVKKNWPLII